MTCSISHSLDFPYDSNQPKLKKTNQYIKQSKTFLWQTMCTEIVSKLRGTHAQKNLVPWSDNYAQQFKAKLPSSSKRLHRISTPKETCSDC